MHHVHDLVWLENYSARVGKRKCSAVYQYSQIYAIAKRQLDVVVMACILVRFEFVPALLFGTANKHICTEAKIGRMISIDGCVKIFTACMVRGVCFLALSRRSALLMCVADGCALSNSTVSQ